MELRDEDSNGPEIGDVDEGIIEGCEDAGNAEYIFTCVVESTSCSCERSWLMPTFADLRTKRDILGSRTLDLLLGRHVGRRQRQRSPFENV